MKSKEEKRAVGCLLGQLAGDALGSLVEFESPQAIEQMYPDGVRDLADGGTWNTVAGQPTDDSELALMLARTLVKCGTYDSAKTQKAYLFWLNSDPFDCGTTTFQGLQGHPNSKSQSNGALMRISPLGIFGAHRPSHQIAEWARQDALLTHPHPICQQSNALFAVALAHAIRTGCKAPALYRQIKKWAKQMKIKRSLLRVIDAAVSSPPSDYVYHEGYVLIAFQNALWQLLHASGPEDGITNTVKRGGDTDTNAAICGALLGAVYGQDAIPTRWVDKLLNCRPAKGELNVQQPRPKCFWPVDAVELATQLLVASS